MVFIGQHLNKEAMVTQLNNCLLTKEEEQQWKEHLFPQKDLWPITL